MKIGWLATASLAVLVSSVFSRPENDWQFQTDIARGGPSEEQPFYVILLAFVTETQIARCGGTLIAPNVVLTAAHCVQRHGPSDIAVLRSDFTATNWLYRSDIIMSSHYLVHPDYKPESHNTQAQNDVALLYLDGSFDLKQPNCDLQLPFCNASDDYPETTGIGLGRTGSDEKDSDILVEVDLRSRKDCQKVYHNFNPEKQLCYYGEVFKGDNTCLADSGGPLVYKKNGKVKCLHGIASYGANCTSDGPGVFARVGVFKDWIENYIETDVLTCPSQ